MSTKREISICSSSRRQGPTKEEKGPSLAADRIKVNDVQEDFKVEYLFKEMLNCEQELQEKVNTETKKYQILTIADIMTICSTTDDDVEKKEVIEKTLSNEMFQEMGGLIQEKYCWPNDTVNAIAKDLSNMLLDPKKPDKLPSQACRDLYPKLETIYQRPFKANLSKKMPPQFAARQVYFYVQLFNVSDIETVEQVILCEF